MRETPAAYVMTWTKFLAAIVFFGASLVLGGCNYSHPAPPRTLKIANITNGQVLSGRFIVYVQPDPPRRSQFYCRVDSSEEYWFDLGSSLNRRVNGQDQLGVQIDSRSFPDGKYMLALRDINGTMGVKTVYFKNGVK